LNFQCCLRSDCDSDHELRIRYHNSKDWIARVLENPTHEIADYNEKHPNKPIKILDERIIKLSDWITGNEKPHEYLNPLYNKIGTRLRENGLLDRIIEKWFDAKQVRPPPLDSEPQVLTFDHVGVAFKISAGFLILALVMFLLEVCYAKIKTVK